MNIPFLYFNSYMQKLKQNVTEELDAILAYWIKNMPDNLQGGFIGEIDCNEEKHPEAIKGSVLHARILWTFAAACAYKHNDTYLAMADRAYQYIAKYFYNETHKGIYWSITRDGKPHETKNQVYALAFVIYGLSEYYAVTQNKEALELAITLYSSIKTYSYDAERGGYMEAYTEDWQEIEDMRLSEKDANEKKTMNTHLHIVEGFANLYRVWKNEQLKLDIIDILEVIDEKFIDKESWHLKLFYDENWIERPDVISYGHDIEAAWLLQWCAEVTEDAALIAKFKHYAVEMTKVTYEGIADDGGLWYELELETNELIAEKHWWPQAELWIGFVNAWQLTGEAKYIETAEKNYDFVAEHLIDKAHGEWFWGVDATYTKIPKDKAGLWKCPYHNGRACLELMKRLP